VVTAGDRDLIAEEPGPLGAGMSDQRLFGRQFQLEVLTQELRQPMLDLLGFGLGPGESEQGVVGLCRLPDYADREVSVLVRGLAGAAGAA
jgi:hypothetical protein